MFSIDEQTTVAKEIINSIIKQIHFQKVAQQLLKHPLSIIFGRGD